MRSTDTAGTSKGCLAQKAAWHARKRAKKKQVKNAAQVHMPRKCHTEVCMRLQM